MWPAYKIWFLLAWGGGVGYWRITGQCHKAQRLGGYWLRIICISNGLRASWALWLIPCEKWFEYQSPVRWGWWGTQYEKQRRGRWGKGILSRRTQPCTWKTGLATRVWTDVSRRLPLCKRPCAVCNLHSCVQQPSVQHMLVPPVPMWTVLRA